MLSIEIIKILVLDKAVLTSSIKESNSAGV